jgi:hypothetical protein
MSGCINVEAVAPSKPEEIMLTQELTTVNAKPGLDQEVIENFKSKLRGELCLPGESGYEQARSIWNGKIERRPARVAR